MQVSSGATKYLDEVFVFSSFVLPLNKQYYLDEFQQNKIEVDQLESSIRVFENIKPDFDGILSNKTQTVELLAVFTAIIAFVVASLPSFEYVNSAFEAMMFMVALATSFSFFVVALSMLLRGNKTLEKNQSTLFFWFIIIIIVWIALFVLDK